MNISVKQPLLLNMLSAAGAMSDHANLKLTTDVLELIAVERGKIALTDCKHAKTDFSEYDVPEPLEIGLRLTELLRLIRRFDKAAIINLGIDESMLLVASTDKSFKLKLIEPDTSFKNLPEIDFNAKVAMDTKILLTALEDIHTLGMWLTIRVDEKSLNFFGSGDMGEASLSPLAQSSGVADVDYSLEFLISMIKAVPESKSITLELGEMQPIKLTFDDGKIVSYLAPRQRDG